MQQPLFAADKIYIIGAGGLGKEVLCCLLRQQDKSYRKNIFFVEEDRFFQKRKVMDISVMTWSEVDFNNAQIVIALGDSKDRERVYSLLPPDVHFPPVIDPTVQLTPYTKIGSGTIVLGQVFLSCDVEIGNFSLINPGTTISHDCKIGDYFSASPGVHISGNCRLGKHVFMGTSASMRDAIKICDETIIGMGAVVTQSISISGTYIGNPARSINKRK